MSTNSAGELCHARDRRGGLGLALLQEQGVTMKRVIIGLCILSLNFFVACGGGDDVPPPPKLSGMDNKNDQQALNDLMMQAMRAKQTCTQDMTPMFIAVAMAAKPQPNALGQPSGGNQPNMAQLLPLLQGQGGGAQCSNDIMNMLMAFTTIQVRQPDGSAVPYANLPDPRMWMASTLAGFTTSVGKEILRRTGINVFTDPALRDQLLGMAANVVQTKIIPNLGGLSGQAAGAFSQYAGGTPSVGADSLGSFAATTPTTTSGGTTFGSQNYGLPGY